MEDQKYKTKYSAQQINDYIHQVKQLVEKHPLAYFNMLQSKKHKEHYKNLLDFIYAYTSFIDYDCKINTRCKYVIDGKDSMYTCQVCGKPIRKYFMATNRQTKFWCSTKCLANDETVNQIIGSNISKTVKEKNIDVKADAKLPEECNIIYRESPIKYDKAKNKKIYDLFLKHQRVFKFWLEKDKELYDYFIDSTYPINYTNLHFGTRLYWLMNEFQEFPRCQVCGRQLDFKDVKMSHNWPTTCCNKCRVDYVAKLTELRHRNHMYDRMLAQDEIEPLYTRDFYIQVGPNYSNFNVKCKKCGYKFSSPINRNFWARSKSNNMFRCPYCHPSTKYRSMVEKKVFKFVKEDLGYIDAMYSYHGVIPPYEVDIYVPSKKTAIEFNGILWHSLENDITMDYHLYKTKRCEDAGIKLIHIWEDEWNHSSDKVKDFIKKSLDGNQQIETTNINGQIYIDRAKFNLVAIYASQHYNVIGETPPIIIKRRSRTNEFSVPNCGSLIVEEVNKV